MARRTNGIVLYTSLATWEPLLVEGAQGYAWIKTLSKDTATGAKTALIRYDTGFRAGPAMSEWPMDIYTLEGEMRCGDRTYRAHTYHYRPPATPIGPIECPDGITRLVFTADSRDPKRSSAEELFIQNVLSDIAPDPPGLAPTGASSGPNSRFYSTGLVPPDPETSTQAPGTSGRWMKILRLDPLAEIAIRVQGVTRAGTRGAPGELHIHPWVEECFMVAGENLDYSADIDGHWRWIRGVYVCRPPDESLHGNSLKLDDQYYLIVRSGWTADPAKAKKWQATQDSTTIPLPAYVTFKE